MPKCMEKLMKKQKSREKLGMNSIGSSVLVENRKCIQRKVAEHIKRCKAPSTLGSTIEIIALYLKPIFVAAKTCCSCANLLDAKACASARMIL